MGLFPYSTGLFALFVSCRQCVYPSNHVSTRKSYKVHSWQSNGPTFLLFQASIQVLNFWIVPVPHPYCAFILNYFLTLIQFSIIEVITIIFKAWLQTRADSFFLYLMKNIIFLKILKFFTFFCFIFKEKKNYITPKRKQVCEKTQCKSRGLGYLLEMYGDES